MTQLSHKLNNEELGSNENPHPITPNKTKQYSRKIQYILYIIRNTCKGNFI